MIDTFFSRLLSRLPSPASQGGDTLIEVLLSALMVALIVVGTFSGLNSTNKATSLDRSRSQADALAEHAEEQLRGEPITRLVALTESHPLIETVKENGSEYTITSTAQFVSDSTGTSSCTSSSEKADYLQTTSRVTSTLIGAGKSVEESGVISPPAGSALIVDVSESGKALPEAKVVARGPSPATTPHELETSAKGCAILALSPGEYSINVSKTGYVTPNGYAKTEEDPSVTHSVYIPVETTSKDSYYLGRESKIEVGFSGGESGDTFVAFNPGMAKLKTFGAVENYKPTVASTTPLYPFLTAYTVYAGTCEANKPPAIKSENEVLVPSGGTGTTTLVLPQLKLKVYGGTSSENKGLLLTGASGSVTDTGCGSKRSFVTAGGAMPHPGLPYGTYKLCVTAANVGTPAKQRRYESTTSEEINLNTAGGVEKSVYLGGDPESSSTTC